MANVAGSFAQGMQIGGGLIDIANRKEDRDNRLSRNKVIEERQDTQWEQSQQDREQSLADRDTARKEHNKDRDRIATIQGREDVAWRHQQEEYNHQKKLKERQEGYNSVFLPAIDKAISSGDFSGLETPEFHSYVKKNPQFDLENILGDKTGTALGDATQILRGAANGQIPDEDDPKLLGAVNSLFPEITNAEGLPSIYTDGKGKQSGITGRRISAVHVMPNGSLTIQQELTLDDGSKVKVPVTENRSSDQNDTVMQVPMSVFSDRMHSLIQSRNHLKQTQLNNYRQLQTGRSLNLDNDGKVITKKNGRGSIRSGGSSTSTSSLVKQQLSEANDINTRYDKQIADIKMQGLEPEEEKAQIGQVENRRVSSIKAHDDLYSGLTDIRNSDLPEARHRSAAEKVLKSVVKQYDAYEFDANDKYQIKQYVLNNPSVSSDDIQSAISAMIESGDVTKKNSNNNTSSSDLVAEIMNNGSNQDSGAARNNNLTEEIKSLPSGNEVQPQYGGELGTALPGYERGEGLSSYGRRVAEGVRDGANNFVDTANGLQSSLQNYVSK
ncbi:hypothetical protein AB733_11695 [Photobacterium swingsii]|uniref:Uncharacterized protein n=1 Tax=Photobacterium swingsii TaxID=680026 RepID=A0A0J8VAN2_9GAMM|nr:hypothetical protein [Photobacterium swingsii]KMV30341.1 hypothetical protein AB733_11695 [Photobacterium swingsii]PSW24495.1 hypothetical protein C9I94_10690 [Photobacterium swingsii]